jgi:hypothetical protein
MRSHLLSDTPVAVIFAVLESVVTLQKWFGHINGPDDTAAQGQLGRGWVCTKPNFRQKSAEILEKSLAGSAKKVKKAHQ